MTEQTTHTGTAIDRLSMLVGARQSAPDYFAPFLDSDDEVLKVGAWCVLLDRQELRPDQLPQLVELSKYAAIRTRAFALLQAVWEHTLAAEVANTELVASEDGAERLVMDATIRGAEPVFTIEALRQFFLATGRTDALRKIVRSVEEQSGWAEALPAAVNGVLLAPHDPLVAGELFMLIFQARRADLLEAALEHFSASNLHLPLQRLFAAGLLQVKDDHAGALREVELYLRQPVARADISAIAQPTAIGIKAESLDKLRRYEDAYVAYVALNAFGQNQSSLDAYPKAVLTFAQLPAVELPPDPWAANHFDMLGFPRSGTTLLENALAAHPRIETFEEVPSMTAVRSYLSSMLPANASPELTRDALIEARERYYTELKMARRKTEVDIFVDKLPIRSSEAQFLVKLFPDKRYIFSIRHPFDVVLSAFKQNFAPNFAMEHFRRMDTAIKLYDFTMTQWFSVFSMDDPRVHYVRYDTLVTDFEPTIRGALAFLGAKWDASVLDFATAAQTRAARTPSYQKVRQGLGIGVQSSWRNYDFLFKGPEAKPLHKWAEFFGYETN